MTYPLLEALNTAAIGVTELSTDGVIASCNRAWPMLLGMTAPEMLGRPLADFVHRDHAALYADAWQMLQRNGRAVVDLRLRCHGDVVGYVQLCLVRFEYHGQYFHYAFASDITLQKTTEQKRTDTLLLQRAIINCTNFGMMSTDLNGTIRSLNATAESWTGYSLDGLQGALAFNRIVLKEDVAERRRQLSREHGIEPESDFDVLVFAARHGLDDEGEWRIRCLNGSVIPVWLTIKALIDDSGELTGYLLIAADLREHKQIERRLQETEALFRNAFEAAANGIAILDLRGNVIRANPACFAILKNPAVGDGSMHGCLDEQTSRVVKSWLDQLLQPGAQAIQEEIEIVTRHGARVWVALSIALMNDVHGLPLYYVVQMQDVSERRRLDGELKLAASVFNSSSEGVYIADQTGHIISVNPAFTHITGWREDEVLGKSVAFFQSDFQPPEFYAEMSKSLDEENFWQGELWSRVKNGKAVLTRLSITRILDEKGALQRSVAVFNDITELRQKDERLLYQAYHDALTDLPNKMKLNERMLTEFQRAQRKRMMVALLCLDIDHFKYINDTLGHDLGDMLLKAVASRLLGTVRESDLVARQGGDEFVILLPEVAELKNVSLVARKIVDAMSASFHLQGHDLRVTVSIGISVFPQDSMSPATLMRHADTAMYRAKEQGRNNFQYYTPTLDKQIKERFTMETSLRKALERDEFHLCYQPKIEFRTGAIVGAEALLRWKHPEMGLVPPTQFIPLAEETGLIGPIGDWVLAVACRDVQRWRSMGFDRLCVAVNLSARQFRQTDLVQRIEIILAETGLQPTGLELELTESMIMHNPQETILALTRLKEMGMTLAVDDFGTGYSSLSYLKRFPIDTLKIDRSFVNDIHTDPDDAAITETIINLAKSLRLSVVAEGVETQEQFDFLHRAGCEYMQGYLFSKPVPANAFETMLVQSRTQRGIAT